MKKFEAVIIGAGTSGIKQAEILENKNITDVLVIEYENQLGGRPWDVGYKDDGLSSKMLFNSKVTKVEIDDDKSFIVTFQNQEGEHKVNAESVYLTTGSVEGERFFDYIPGDRPSGDMLPKLGLNILKRGYAPGYNPLIVNSNEYANELIEKLKGFSEVSVIEISPNDFEILKVNGISRVESVEVKNLSTSRKETIQCDAFVYANGIKPLSHSVKELPLELDNEKFVLTNDKGETSIDGLYAYGDVARIK